MSASKSLSKSRRTLAIDLTLPARSKPAETVVVTEDIPLLNTTTSTLGGTLSNREINELPLNGRNYENLLQLRPGVVRYPGGGFSTTSSNGLRAEDNAYLIDGLFNSEPFSGQSIINGAGIAGDSATILPIDSIQEFNLQQNPPAEYGWKPGLHRQCGFEIGHKQRHGTAYAFGRDTPLDARNYFNPSPAEKSHETSSSSAAASAARSSKIAFFFGAYEGQRYTVGNTGTLTTPLTVRWRRAVNPPGSDNSVIDALAEMQANWHPHQPGQPADRGLHSRARQFPATARASPRTTAPIPTVQPRSTTDCPTPSAPTTRS